MIEITLKKFDEVSTREILEAGIKYDEIAIDGDERVVLFKRTSYLLEK
jgi:hypothetical protein